MNDDDEVRAVMRRFYTAIDDMMSGKGLTEMREVWHHTDRVTSGHPSGDWSKGWDEVWATWEVFASFGRPKFAGSKVLSLDAHVYGDVAYATCVFQIAPYFGTDKLQCTNVLHKLNGTWKLVHHHADKSPAIAAGLERAAAEE